MKVIRVGGYKLNDKVVIAKKYLLNTITKELGYSDCNYRFEDVVIRDMINQYTFEGGVRKLKELLTDIIMEINLRKITGQKVGGIDPTDTMTITKKMIRDDIFKDKHPIQHTMAGGGNQVGLVNGLWANSYGIGGLIPIEAHIIPTASKFDLQLTGMQGKVMEESMKVAKTVAWRLLTPSRQSELMKSWKDEGTSGVHIHCPDGSTPKDGPSAGGAITTCLVSLLSGTPVDQSFAMTGEINLKGDITAIGGLEEKTFGAITAGVKTILFPKENQRDADKINEKFPDLKIKMIPVDRIEQILNYVLVKK
jgi:ATP-dependent Lon protease